MNITIKDTNASRSILDQSVFLWKLYAKKMMKFFILMYSVGFALFIFGITQFSDSGWKMTSEGYTHYTNWHLAESFGFVLLLVATYMLITHRMAKNQFFKNARVTADRHLKTTNEIVIQVTDNSLAYRSYELSQDIKWWVFSRYTLAADYLFLSMEGGPSSYIVIDRRLLGPEDFSELLEFVKKRIVPVV